MRSSRAWKVPSFTHLLVGYLLERRVKSKQRTVQYRMCTKNTIQRTQSTRRGVMRDDARNKCGRKCRASSHAVQIRTFCRAKVKVIYLSLMETKKSLGVDENSSKLAMSSCLTWIGSQSSITNLDRQKQKVFPKVTLHGAHVHLYSSSTV